MEQSLQTVVEGFLEGTMSQVFYLGFSFYFLKFRKLSFNFFFLKLNFLNRKPFNGFLFFDIK